MTAPLALRVMVPDAWDEVQLELPPATPLAELKRRALEASRVSGDPRAYVALSPRRGWGARAR